MRERRYPSARLLELAGAILRAAGVPRRDAATVADCLVAANLEGVDTHGIARLPVYARRVARGLINPRPRPRVVRARGAAAVVDGDNGLGPVVGVVAIDEAVRRARRYGVAWVGVRHSNHVGHAGYYCHRAARRGMIGLASSSGEPCVAPWGGRQALFSNNPFGFAAPAPGGPVVVDMATSVASRGHILIAARTGRRIPAGGALDAGGWPTTDAAAALAGSVLPMAGAKGYALIVALEILSGVLSGGAFAPRVRSQHNEWAEPTGNSHFFAAIDPAAFMPRRRFLARMRRLAADVRRSPRRPGGEPVRMPGERRRRTAAERRRVGIPLERAIVDDINGVARELGVPEARWLS